MCCFSIGVEIQGHKERTRAKKLERVKHRVKDEGETWVRRGEKSDAVLCGGVLISKKVQVRLNAVLHPDTR